MIFNPLSFLTVVFVISFFNFAISRVSFLRTIFPEINPTTLLPTIRILFINIRILWALIEGDVSDGVYVSCTVEDANGDLWAGTAEAITGSYFGIEVGDCFDFPTATSNALEIDCNEPHEGEMYIVDELVLDEDPSAPYPTEDEWDEIATFICDGPFEDYTGYSTSDENVNLSYSYVFVLEEDWYDVASRQLSCVVVSYDGTLLEGSTR